MNLEAKLLSGEDGVIIMKYVWPKAPWFLLRDKNAF